MIVLIGKSGVGKDTIKKELIKSGMKSVVCHTTRPMREGEVDGFTYHFVSDDEFHKLESEGFFAETVHYDVADNSRWFYGSSYKELLEDSLDKVVILNPSGIKTLFEKLEPSKLWSWLVVYLYCDEKITNERLILRGDNPKEAKRRIEADDRDFADIYRYVDMKVCNDGHSTPEQIAKEIREVYDRFLVEG